MRSISGIRFYVAPSGLVHSGFAFYYGASPLLKAYNSFGVKMVVRQQQSSEGQDEETQSKALRGERVAGTKLRRSEMKEI